MIGDLLLYDEIEYKQYIRKFSTEEVLERYSKEAIKNKDCEINMK